MTNADGYRSAIRGVTVDTIRTGVGDGPNRIASRRGQRAAVTRVSVGYPILSHSVIPEDRITVAVIEASPGGRWVGVDHEPGLVFVYGPELEHEARNPAGTQFRFAAIDIPALEDASDTIGVPLSIPDSGRFTTLPAGPGAGRLSRAIGTALGAQSASSQLRTESDLLASVVRTLQPSTERRGSRRRIDSRQVTRDCLEFAESAGRIPSMVELCEAAFVCERRVRSAFAEVYDLPPTAFFRMWALAKADQRLRSTEHHPGLVTRVALDLGISHLGRFSARYREVYGLLPSESPTPKG